MHPPVKIAVLWSYGQFKRCLTVFMFHEVEAQNIIEATDQSGFLVLPTCLVQGSVDAFHGSRDRLRTPTTSHSRGSTTDVSLAKSCTWASSASAPRDANAAQSSSNFSPARWLPDKRRKNSYFFTRGHSLSESGRNASSAGIVATTFMRSHSPFDSDGFFACKRYMSRIMRPSSLIDHDRVCIHAASLRSANLNRFSSNPAMPPGINLITKTSKTPKTTKWSPGRVVASEPRRISPNG
jgi:hypothetical protein